MRNGPLLLLVGLIALVAACQTGTAKEDITLTDWAVLICGVLKEAATGPDVRYLQQHREPEATRERLLDDYGRHATSTRASAERLDRVQPPDEARSYHAGVRKVVAGVAKATDGFVGALEKAEFEGDGLREFNVLFVNYSRDLNSVSVSALPSLVSPSPEVAGALRRAGCTP